jgi:hypothetical protein
MSSLHRRLVAIAFGLSSSAMLAACGGASSAPASVPMPTVSLAAGALVQGSSTLTWTSTNATGCTASGAWSGSVATSGSQVVSPAATSTYTLTCTGSGGSAAQSATVTVAALPAPTATLAANPASIAAGGSSTLSWSSTNASSCMATGAWTGARVTSGTLVVSPTATATYSLSCTGAGGTSPVKSATITVAAVTPAPTVTLSATPATIALGGTSQLSWTSTNATTCNASGAWSGTMATSGTYTTPALAAASSFTLSCSGAGGIASQTVMVAIQGDAPTAASAGTVGAYATATYTSGLGGGAHIAAGKVWYPTNATAPLPCVVYIAGSNTSFNDPPETVVINGQTVVEVDQAKWGTFLASHGFAFLFLDATAAANDPTGRMNALLEGIDVLMAENTRAGSPLLGKLQVGSVATMGHSFGGAGALLAANGNTDARIKVAVGLSPVSGLSTPYPTLVKPALIIGGVGDPYNGNFPNDYNSIPATTTKMLADFKTSAEFSSMHAVAIVPLGTHTTDPEVARYALSFLETYLVGDQRYTQFLVTNPDLATFNYHP